MFGSIRLGTILGIPVGVNWTVLLIAWLIAFSLAAQLLPAQVPGLADAAYWVAGAAAAALFFGSLLAHELSHAVVARREGLKVSGITLWLLGGVATMKGEAQTPGAEARIAGVGPLTSFLLALAFGAAAIGLSLAPASDAVALALAASGWLSLVNLVLAVFNLLPGAPLDGGRIARAVLWRWRGDKMQATRWSTGLGQVFGYGLAGIGVLRIAGGDLGGAWFLLLGFFLSSAAGAERRSSELLETLRGVSVGDIMTRDPLRVPASLTADTFLLAAMGESRASTWLTTGPSGVITGLLGLERLRAVRGDARRTTRIGELAQPIATAPRVYADEHVADVLGRLEGQPTRAVVWSRSAAAEPGREPVMAEAVLGLLTPEDISRAIEVGRMTASDDERSSSPSRGPSEGPVWP